jgi:iduronate 2-sulfatase
MRRDRRKTDRRTLMHRTATDSFDQFSSRELTMFHLRSWFPWAAIAVASVSLPDSTIAEQPDHGRRPNVLLIISDDLNNALGCYGDALVKTPHLDRLAARGVRFQHAYCTFPLCGPSRNSLLTGLYPNSTGILSNQQIFRQTIPDQVCLPQAFRQAGYFVARIGKLYHYNVPNSVGTDGHDDPASWELELNPAGVDRLVEQPQIVSLVPGQFGGTLSWYASTHADEQHTDGMLADGASWVLERCRQRPERPFFLAVGFFRPHTPYVAPRDPYFGHYPIEQMPVVAGVAEDQADIPRAGLASRQAVQDAMTDGQRREARQAYYASITFMDAQVGKLLETLDRLQLTDQTIIVFTSDHGYHLGEHGLWQKLSLFEPSARVPLLMVAPGATQTGSVVMAPVSHLDLYPTLTELCGVDAPKNVQGQSLVPLLQDASAPHRGWALSQVERPASARESSSDREDGPFFGYSLRTPRWRYTEWDGGREGRELYDHRDDPGELRNLAKDPAHAGTCAELAAQLATAVAQSMPADGQTPPLRGEAWAPRLLDP